MKGGVDASDGMRRARRLVLSLLLAVAAGSFLVAFPGCGSDHSAGVSLGGSPRPTAASAGALRVAPTPTATPSDGGRETSLPASDSVLDAR